MKKKKEKLNPKPNFVQNCAILNHIFVVIKSFSS